jgi:hypothetical protein
MKGWRERLTAPAALRGWNPKIGIVPRLQQAAQW